MAPAMLLLLVAVIAPPVIFLAWTSLRTAPAGTPGASFTLDAWRELLSARSLNALKNTVLVSAFTTMVAVPLGLFFAWLESQTDTPLVKRLSSLLIVPLIFSPLLTAVAWVTLSSPNAGVVNVTARNLFGIDVLFNVYSIPGMVLVSSMYFTPVAYLATRSSMRAIDASVIEAARISGATLAGALRRALLPLLRPAVAAASMLIFTMGIGLFSVVSLLGPNARVSTLQYQAFTYMNEAPTQPSRAAAIGVLLLLITIVNMTFYRRIQGSAIRYRTITGKGLTPVRVNLGKFRYLATAVLILFLFMSIILPYAAIFYASMVPFMLPELQLDSLSLTNFSTLLENPTLIRAMRNTAILAFVGATLTALVATTIGYLVKKSKGRLGRYLEVVSMMPLAIPALAFALGLLWFMLSFEIGRSYVYGTLIIIYLGQLASYLPLGIQIIGASVTQLGDDIEDAARVTGCPPLARIRYILVPLLKPAIASTWLVLALYATTETGLSIFLYTGASLTTPVVIFNNASAGAPGIMYASAMVLATVGLVAIAIGNYFFGASRHLANR